MRWTLVRSKFAYADAGQLPKTTYRTVSSPTTVCGLLKVGWVCFPSFVERSGAKNEEHSFVYWVGATTRANEEPSMFLLGRIINQILVLVSVYPGTCRFGWSSSPRRTSYKSCRELRIPNTSPHFVRRISWESSTSEEDFLYTSYGTER